MSGQNHGSTLGDYINIALYAGKVVGILIVAGLIAFALLFGILGGIGWIATR